MSDEADSDFDDVTNEERSLADNSDKDDDEEQQDEIKVDWKFWRQKKFKKNIWAAQRYFLRITKRQK